MVSTINNDKTFNVTDNCLELMGGTREIRKVYFENLRISLNNADLLQQLAALADQIIEVEKIVIYRKCCKTVAEGFC